MKATIIHLFFILPLLDLKSDLILVILLCISLICIYFAYIICIIFDYDEIKYFFYFDHLFFFHEPPALLPTWC